jgi:deoxyadenosine/deoxycytidine kinase
MGNPHYLLELFQGVMTISLENKYQELVVLSCSVKVLARLHARGKPNEQFDKCACPLNESDAEEAVESKHTIVFEHVFGCDEVEKEKAFAS